MKPINEYRWTIEPTRNIPEGTTDDLSVEIKKLVEDLKISPILARLLINRSITTYETARAFFRPEWSDLNDPLLMDGMKEAVARTIASLKKNDTILIYGDYDVDGTNGTALLYTFFKSCGSNVHYYIPDRIKEGYGISRTGIDYGKELNASLLISVDCGITANDQVEYARSLGIDVIICDHHEPGANIPNAFAVLDPLKPNCQYPFKQLCGCGVAFKFIQALHREGSLKVHFISNEEEALKPYLDYVALATAADIVPLIDENRTLTKLGLELINSKPRPGIHALMEVAGLKLGKITTGNIVFGLAPRINAVGRLGDATRAVKLLTTTTFDAALGIARVCEQENQNRRRLDEEAFNEAQQMVEKTLGDVPAIVLHKENWHPGVIGIVASRLVDKYHRPTIMMTTIDGAIRGSARSIPGFDLYSALKSCECSLLQFGGHKYAAGLSVESSKIDEFRKAFVEVAQARLTKELLTPSLQIESEVELSEITPKFIRILNQFAPWGPMNPRPVFASRRIQIYNRPRIVGNNHLQMKVKDETRIFDTIGFNLGDYFEKVSGQQKIIDIAFTVDQNEYNGEVFPQLTIKDIK